MSAKKPAMRDIARAVGTSAVTVSKALAGKTGMSDRLRTRILRKAEEMGYRYPQSGRRVLPEHMNIGILIPERYVQADSFYAEMYRKLIRRLSGQGHFGLLEILNAKLKNLAEKYGVGAAQIPVAWAIAKGTLPIIGVTKENQVLDAVKAANVTLTAEDAAELERLADSLNLNVIRFWEKEMK